MGNNNSTYNNSEQTFRKSIYRRDKPEDTTLIVNKIHEISKVLWNEYTTKFLDPNFCDHVALAYTNRLTNLTVKQLRAVNNSLNKNNKNYEQFDLVLTHNTKDTDKFITDQFKSKLTDMFEDDKRVNLSYKLGEIKAIIDGDDNNIFYINPEIKNYLNKKINQYGGQHPDDIVSQDMNMPPQKLNSPQKPIDDMSDIEALFANIEDEIYNNNKEEKLKSETEPKAETEVVVETETETETETEPEPEPEPKAEPEAEPEAEAEVVSETKLEPEDKVEVEVKKNINNSRYNANINANEILKSIENINKNLKKNNKNNKNNKKNKNLQKIDENLNKIKEDIKNTKFSNYNTNNKVIVNDDRDDNECNLQNKTCGMNKYQLCKAISNHYIIRSNIIAAILTMIPHKDPKTQDYEGSFCFDRLRSLNQGSFCLPPNLSEFSKIPIDQQAAKLQKYIGKSKNQCDVAKGDYKLLTPKETKVLSSSNDEYNKIYIAYTEQLQERYRQYLVKLLEILEILAGEININNKELERVANDTKELIDNMYKMCQFNYLMAMLAFIKLDLSRDNAYISREDRHRESLYSGLE